MKPPLKTGVKRLINRGTENWLESDVEKQINLKKKTAELKHKLIQVSKKSVLPKKKGVKVHYSPEFPINGRFTQGGNVLLVQFSGHTAFMMRVHARTLCTLWDIIFHKSTLFHVLVVFYSLMVLFSKEASECKIFARPKDWRESDKSEWSEEPSRQQRME